MKTKRRKMEDESRFTQIHRRRYSARRRLSNIHHSFCFCLSPSLSIYASGPNFLEKTTTTKSVACAVAFPPQNFSGSRRCTLFCSYLLIR
nr:hypothetical protein Iba_chr05fCG1760 [Ipomoea batatas]